MKIAITGANGFLGWHLQCALLAGGDHVIVALGRPDMVDAVTLRDRLTGCDAVVHLAGVNRGTDAEVEEGNRSLARTLAAALDGSTIRTVVHGNSIHTGSESPFGRSKAFATEELSRAASRTGASFTDVLLPNIFGEGGRPYYNSVIATFAYELVSGKRPAVINDRELPLLHAQDAADVLIDVVTAALGGVVRPEGTPTLVSEALEQLQGMADYLENGEFPDLSSRFNVALFNTFQSFCFPNRFPFDRTVHADPRGILFESTRARRTDTLSFVSTTVPGAVRGEHFHRRKVERFLVVDGEAEIRMKRLVTGETVTFRVSGDIPQAVDMPPLWAHSLKNIGTRTTTTVFWANELINTGSSDTYPARIYT